MSDKFDSFPVGAKRSFTHRITAEDVRRFIELSGDTNPVHADADFAARTPLARPVVHGMLTGAYVSRLVGKYLPGDGALWVAQSFEFAQPAFVGDILSIEAEVRQRSESQRLLVIDVRVRNQSGQTILTGEGKVQVMAMAEEAEAPAAPRPRVALVTGASRGIGAACARRLARDHHAIAVNYASDRAGAEAVVGAIIQAGGRAVALAGDVRDPAAVERLVEETIRQLGGLSVLVNNAGTALRLKAAAQLGWDDMQANLDLYLRAPFLAAKAVLPHFQAQGGGSIVNLGSIAADSRPPAKFAAYAVAKEALWALTKNLAGEWGAHGIRVNLVSPGMTETALIGDIPAKARLLTKMDTPLRRLATPDDVANAVAFLAGDGAGHISGENLRVCGGAVML